MNTKAFVNVTATVTAVHQKSVRQNPGFFLGFAEYLQREPSKSKIQLQEAGKHTGGLPFLLPTPDGPVETDREATGSRKFRPRIAREICPISYGLEPVGKGHAAAGLRADFAPGVAAVDGTGAATGFGIGAVMVFTIGFATGFLAALFLAAGLVLAAFFAGFLAAFFFAGFFLAAFFFAAFFLAAFFFAGFFFAAFFFAGFFLAAAFFFAAGFLAAAFFAAGLLAAFFAAFFAVAISNLLHKSYRKILPKAQAGLPGLFNDPHPRVDLG